MLIILFSSSSFGDNISDKLRRISLQNGFNLSDTSILVPKGWNHLISEYGRLHDIKNDIVDRLKSDKKPCKYFNKLYLENIE
jgi:hypothetical protein